MKTILGIKVSRYVTTTTLCSHTKHACFVVAVSHTPPFQPTTSVIDVFDRAELVVEDNCFLNNDLIGRGAVLLETADQIISAVNNFGTFDAGLKCQFIHIDGGDECIDYDITDSCPIDFVYDVVREPSPPDGANPEGTEAVATSGAVLVRTTTVVATGLLLVVAWL